MSPLDEPEQPRKLIDEQAVANGFGPWRVAEVTVFPVVLTGWIGRRGLAAVVFRFLMSLRIEATCRSDDRCSQHDRCSA